MPETVTCKAKNDKPTLRTIIYILTFMTFIGCCNGQNPNGQKNESDSLKVSKATDNTEDKKQIQFNVRQLESFFDSVGKLPTQPLMDKVAFMTDSIFNNQIQIDKLIPLADFNKLKQAIKSGEIACKTVKNIFGAYNIDSASIDKETIPITCFSFDKSNDGFDEFALCLGYPNAAWDCDLYFFKSNTIIAKHNIHHRYGLELKHYKDTDGKTVIYYKQNYTSGSGIWWFNFYFYKYYDNKLIPVLNELENGNLQFPWGIRVFWLESFVQKTNPLTLKMIYNQAFSDSTISPEFVDDSTIVQYHWDENSKKLIGNYEKSKITKPQILTYYLEDNEILFINAYYKTLKKCLNDKIMRQAILNYLNKVKNHYNIF